MVVPSRSTTRVTLAAASRLETPAWAAAKSRPLSPAALAAVAAAALLASSTHAQAASAVPERTVSAGPAIDAGLDLVQGVGAVARLRAGWWLDDAWQVALVGGRGSQVRAELDDYRLWELGVSASRAVIGTRRKGLIATLYGNWRVGSGQRAASQLAGKPAVEVTGRTASLWAGVGGRRASASGLFAELTMLAGPQWVRGDAKASAQAVANDDVQLGLATMIVIGWMWESAGHGADGRQ